jgi:TetR/AcrR family fatty acid metabolism transcriptional regulator
MVGGGRRMSKAVGKEKLIRQAAVRLFSRKGFYKTRAEEIAQEAGVAVGTIYNYFANKEEILLSIFQAEFEERIELFRELLASDLSLPEMIQRILEAHFALLKQRRGLARVLVRERFNPGPGFEERSIELYREMIGHIEKLISIGIKQGVVRPCHPRIVANALVGVVESISVCAMTSPEEEIQGILEEAPPELTDLMWNGLKKA